MHLNLPTMVAFLCDILRITAQATDMIHLKSADFSEESHFERIHSFCRKRIQKVTLSHKTDMAVFFSEDSPGYRYRECAPDMLEFYA